MNQTIKVEDLQVGDGFINSSDVDKLGSGKCSIYIKLKNDIFINDRTEEEVKIDFKEVYKLFNKLID
jgi:hypothetical protein